MLLRHCILSNAEAGRIDFILEIHAIKEISRKIIQEGEAKAENKAGIPP